MSDGLEKVLEQALEQILMRPFENPELTVWAGNLIAQLPIGAPIPEDPETPLNTFGWALADKTVLLGWHHSDATHLHNHGSYNRAAISDDKCRASDCKVIGPIAGWVVRSKAPFPRSANKAELVVNVSPWCRDSEGYVVVAAKLTRVPLSAVRKASYP